MKTILIALLALPAPAALLAAVPVRWTVETSRVQPAVFDVVRGESIALEATLQSYGKPLEAAPEDAWRIYWQTNGMGSAWWSAPARATGNVLRASWTPAMDPGVPAVTGFIGSTGDNYRATFQLRFRHGPGATPNALPLPTPRIDFAAVEVANAPWAEADRALSRDEADGLYYPRDEGALWSSWWSGDGFRVAVSNYDVAAASGVPFDRLPAAAFEYRPGGTGELVRVWDERTRWERARLSFGAYTNAVAAALAGKAGVDWGRTTPTGFDAPEGFTWLDTPAVAVAGGLAWQKTVTGEGAVWLLSSNGLVAGVGGATNGNFRVWDMATGEAALEIVQGERRSVGANCGETFTWTAADGKTRLRVVYNVASDGPPKLHVAAGLDPQGGTVWHDEGAEGCPAAFAGWTGASGAWTNALWRASAPAAGAADALFCFATYETGGETVVRNRAPVEMSKLVLGGVTYALGTATIDGRTVLTLTPQGGK